MCCSGTFSASWLWIEEVSESDFDFDSCLGIGRLGFGDGTNWVSLGENSSGFWWFQFLADSELDLWGSLWAICIPISGGTSWIFGFSGISVPTGPYRAISHGKGYGLYNAKISSIEYWILFDISAIGFLFIN